MHDLSDTGFACKNENIQPDETISMVLPWKRKTISATDYPFFRADSDLVVVWKGSGHSAWADRREGGIGVARVL